MIVAVLILSIALQLANAALALNAMRQTGGKRVWGALCAAMVMLFLLHACRLYGEWGGRARGEPDLVPEMLFPAVSLLFFFVILSLKTLVKEMRDTARSAAESEERYRKLVESNPAGIMIHRAGRIEHMNPAALEMFGFADAGEAEGWAVYDLIDSDYREIARERARRLLETRRANEPIEQNLRRRNGESFPAETRAMLLEWNGVPAVLEIVRDIGREKQIGGQLRFQSQLLDSVRESVVATSLDGRVIYWGNGAKALYGYDASEAIGEKVTFIVDAESEEDERRRMREVRKNGFWRGQYWRKRKDGSRFWADTSISLIRGHMGKPVGMVGIDRDITDRKMAKDRLEKSERLYREAIEVANAVPYYQNYLTETYDYVGEGIKDLTGYPPEAFTPELWKSLVLESVLFDELKNLSMRAAVTKAREGKGAKWRADYLIRTRGGKERWVMNAAVQERDEEGRVIGSLGILQDITSRKMLEERLYVSQKMEALGLLAGGIAHDFNNLLMVINGYADVLMDRTRPGDPIHGEVREIKLAGERAAQLTTQLLAFGRKQFLQPKVIDLNQHLRGMYKMLKRVIGEDIELRLSPEADHPCVKADPGQIEQIVMNLVINAREAMPCGGWIHVETRNADIRDGTRKMYLDLEPGAYVTLSIRDGGSGMDKETIAHIFEPFFTTKRQSKGTGLGLATVYGIVKQSGGGIEVESVPGEGTAFNIYLPASGGRAAEPGGNGVEERLQGGTETILLVEDEEPVRHLVKNVLCDNGYRVIEASNGIEALKRCGENPGPPDLVITDVVMPGMGGPELAERLRECHPRPHILFISGYAGNAVANHGLDGPEVNFLEKPFKLQDLLAKIHAILHAPPEPRDS